jgi:hypothetical protein
MYSIHDFGSQPYQHSSAKLLHEFPLSFYLVRNRARCNHLLVGLLISQHLTYLSLFWLKSEKLRTLDDYRLNSYFDVFESFDSQMRGVS